MNDLVCFNKNDELKGVVQSKSRFKVRRKKELFQHLFISNSEYDVLLSQEFNLKFKTSFWNLTYE